ncbi:hypothetical protein Tco_1162162 [Tanacetum coccineum]
MDQKVHVFAARQAENKRRLGNNQETTMCSNHLSRDRMWQGPTLLGLVKRKSMLEPYLCVINANFTILVRALQSVEIARGYVQLLMVKTRMICKTKPETKESHFQDVEVPKMVIVKEIDLEVEILHSSENVQSRQEAIIKKLSLEEHRSDSGEDEEGKG